MKTNYRPGNSFEPKSTKAVRGLFGLAAAILVFAAVFYATTFALGAAGTLIGLGTYLPGIREVSHWFSSKSALAEENRFLRERVEWLEDEARIASVYRRENSDLKKALGDEREGEELVLGVVIAHPNISPYDTLIATIPSETQLSVGELALALPHSAIGTILSLEEGYATIGLFSAPNRETQVFVGDAEIPALLVGRGGGNFRIKLPKDANVIKGDLVVLAEDVSRVIGVVGAIEPGDDSSSISLLVSYPLNIFTIPRVFFVHQ